MPFLVHRADVRIALGETASAIDADFEVEALEKKWQRIPLLGGEARLDKAEAGVRSIVWDDGYALLTHAPGRTPVSLHLAARGVRQLGVPLKLKLGSASVKRVRHSRRPRSASERRGCRVRGWRRGVSPRRRRGRNQSRIKEVRGEADPIETHRGFGYSLREAL